MKVGGRTLTFDVPPVIENGRTLVPLRGVFEAMGAAVEWDPPSRTATVTRGDVTVKLLIDGKAFRNDAEVNIDCLQRLLTAVHWSP